MVHTETEDEPWSVFIGDHVARTDSPGYKRSRKLMIKAVQQSQPWLFGPPAYQDHHGGGAWVQTSTGPRMYLLPVGIEWSAQFAADPVKVDLIRRWADDLVAAFPLTIPWYTELGMTAADLAILTTPITDPAGVAAWTDSFWNASVPLPALLHTGTLPRGGGYHHYPKPIIDIAVFKHDDFVLFVPDGSGGHAAVVPVAPRGSGVSEVRVLHADPHSDLGKAHLAAEHDGRALILPGDSRQAAAAFAKQ